MGMYDQLTQLEKEPSKNVKREARTAKPQSKKPTTEPNDRTEEPFGATVRSNRSTEPPSLLQELTEGTRPPERPTERYSFEIYTDQKARVYEIQHAYLKRTGQKLAASRIIRDALGEYLDRLDAVRDKRP